MPVLWETLLGMPVANGAQIRETGARLFGSDGDRLNTLMRQLKELETEWPRLLSTTDRLRLGLYSPAQLIWSDAGAASAPRLALEFPFLFETVGRFIDMCLFVDPEGAAGERIAGAPEDGADDFRRLVQTFFHLRELREEGEALSLEVRLPFVHTDAPSMVLKRLSQVFGRGIGVSRSAALTALEAPMGSADTLFTDHRSAPMGALYNLEAPFAGIARDQLALVLRRDGLVTIAAQSNPILEFYDGGWHVVDLQAGRATLAHLLQEVFPGASPPEFSESLARLAYHLASHGHGAILAVVDETSHGQALDEPSADAKRMNEAVSERLETLGEGKTMTHISEGGYGRLLLSCAIQDGAVVFAPDGTFHSTGRMAKHHAGTPMSGGARRRAARSMARFGVVVQVSQDGAIRLFSKDESPGSALLEGLRVR